MAKQNRIPDGFQPVPGSLLMTDRQKALFIDGAYRAMCERPELIPEATRESFMRKYLAFKELQEIASKLKELRESITTAITVLGGDAKVADSPAASPAPGRAASAVAANPSATFAFRAPRVSVPPPGMASRALTHRFMSA